jgi:Protoporphyrinogen oxidase
LGSIPAERHGEEVAVIGAGISGLVAAYELMKLGVRPVVYEASQMGGRLRSQPFEGAKGVVAELGGMRFPISSSSFYHYVDKLGLQTLPFPNPLTEAAGSTVVDLEGETYYAGSLGDLPPLFTEVADAWAQALEEARFTDIQNAIRARDVATLKSLWNDSCPAGTTARSTTSSRHPRRSRNSRSGIARSSARSGSAPAAGTRTFPTPCWRSSGS